MAKLREFKNALKQLCRKWDGDQRHQFGHLNLSFS